MKEDFIRTFENSTYMLMEGALAERLKHEYGLEQDKDIAISGYIYDEKSAEALETIWKQYVHIAEKYKFPIMLTTPTRRASKEKVERAGYDRNIIIDNVKFLKKIKAEADTKVFVGALMGCKGNAYKATEVLDEKEAFKFHSWQTELFLEAGADFLYAGIMPTLPEAIGMARAMEKTKLPYIISFMIRNNGRLIDGTTINDAIKAIDAATQENPICYMTNCVHPTVVNEALACPFNNTALVRKRFLGIQANTSALPPEELDCCGQLKTSDKDDLASEIMNLSERYNFKIYGGCCGTDNTHMEEIAKRLAGRRSNVEI